MTEHTGNLGCFGEDPKGRELEIVPPQGNISSMLLTLWQSSLQGTNLPHPKITRDHRDLLCTRQLGSSSLQSCAWRGPLQWLNPATSAGIAEGPAHHGSSFGPADLANQTPRGPQAP